MVDESPSHLFFPPLASRPVPKKMPMPNSSASARGLPEHNNHATREGCQSIIILFLSVYCQSRIHNNIPAAFTHEEIAWCKEP